MVFHVNHPTKQVQNIDHTITTYVNAKHLICSKTQEQVCLCNKQLVVQTHHKVREMARTLEFVLDKMRQYTKKGSDMSGEQSA